MSSLKKYAVFTIDVERFCDTECVAKSGVSVEEDMLDGLDRYIGILNRYDIKATLFVLNRAVSKIEDKLRDYVAMGHTIALHGGLEHRPSNELTDKEFREEVLFAKTSLEQQYQTEIRGYRAPFFGIDKEKLEILKELGFLYDSSLLDCTLARYHKCIDMSDYEKPFNNIYKKESFYEFGLQNQKMFGCNFPISGGGYLRLADWNIMQGAIKKYIKENNYYAFYLHPFELSKKKTPELRGLKLYDKIYLKFGHLSMPKKIEKIIKILKKENYTFVTFDELTQLV